MPVSESAQDPRRVPGSGVHTQQSYECPAEGEWMAQISIKRSRFIAVLARTPDEQHARVFIDAIASRYPDARHHCTAFIVRVDGAQPIVRSSDDGEPSGTAGQPMLEVLRGSGLYDVTLVVVRYFGGVKLGTGGLVRAYQSAARSVLQKVVRVHRRLVDVVMVTVPYQDAGRLEAGVRSSGMTVMGVDYGEQVHMQVAGAGVEALVARMSSGQWAVKSEGRRWVEEIAGGECSSS